MSLLNDSQFKKAFALYDINSESSVKPFIDSLDIIAHDLARNHSKREELGSDTLLWPDLRKLWRDLAHVQLTFWDDEAGTESEREALLKSLCLSVSRFTRNLVPGVPSNQVQAFENEPDVRRLLHHYTSWSAMEDNQVVPVTRMLAQTLSNLVTSNEDLVMRLWEAYMSLSEDQAVLIRLLSFPDDKIKLTTLIFIMNCIRDCKERITLLCGTAVGSRLCVTMLDAMVSLYDAAELSDGAQAFDIGYEIFTQLIEQGCVPDLYSRFSMTDEPITPHQTTLLKIVDSYLQSNQMQKTSSKMLKTHSTLTPLLTISFFSLSAYAQSAIKCSLSSATKDMIPTELDMVLPKVCEALVLLTQCITTISLDAEEQRQEDSSGALGHPYTNLKVYMNNQRHNDQGLVENLVELLRLLDLFLPRINFGKPVSSAPLSALKTSDQTHDTAGFSYLKRDLVRLLGILCYKEKEVQDRVRICGGIPIVMNSCVIDERNPYLKEHAILTLHNLLENNMDNQKVVDSIKPVNNVPQNKF
ncbi:hypothetical protein AX17_003585 [Amanita inopinata Kibby_2008]|nr:hypothetical protein AX17_003585 [Amanita inopinata Kibby_2008]